MQSSFSITLVSLLFAVSSTYALVLPRSSKLAARSVIFHRRALSGQATFYGGNVHGGTCSFSDYTLPNGVYGTALSASNWANSTECGACVNVQGPGGNNITAMVFPSPLLDNMDCNAKGCVRLLTNVPNALPTPWTYFPPLSRRSLFRAQAKSPSHGVTLAAPSLLH